MRIPIVLVGFALTATSLPISGCISEHTSGPDADLNALCTLPISELQTGTAFVPMRGFAFLVDTLRVKVGTRVTWVNCEAPSGDAHTATSDDGVWDSPFIPTGSTYSRTFNTVGRFPYHCIPHPTMRAVVIVE